MDKHQLCVSCHQDVQKVIGSVSHPHKPVTDGDCYKCHTPHASAFLAVRRVHLAPVALVGREYEIHTQMLARDALPGWRIVEVAMTRDRRPAECSDVRRVRDRLRRRASILPLHLGSLVR